MDNNTYCRIWTEITVIGFIDQTLNPHFPSGLRLFNMCPPFFPLYSVLETSVTYVINIFINDVFLNHHVQCSLVSASVMANSFINRTV